MVINNESTLLSVLIPVRNERINIRIMVRILGSTLDIPHEILIIYDHPKDSSVPAAKDLKKKFPQVKLILNNSGKGVTNAIKAGIAKSSGKYILLFASDDVGPVLAIDDMLQLMNKGCDLVSCTRYAHGGRRLGGSQVQAALSRLGNYFYRFIVGTSLTDSTTGIKMFRRTLIDKITLESQVGWAAVFEIAIKAQMLGAQFGEVPIMSIDRLYGGSSAFKIGPWVNEYLRWFFYGAFNLRKGKNKKVLIKIPQNM